MDIIESEHILKNLHDVLLYAKERYNKEFYMQEVELTDAFKKTFQNYLKTKGCTIEYFKYTTIVTNASRQNIYIANQWFVIASYFVDFCTEMLTYRSLFEKICRHLGMNNKDMKEYATRLRTSPSLSDRSQYIHSALNILESEFPDTTDDYTEVSNLLWNFASNYDWWSGNKTIDRHDFFISPLLNQLNVVNANSEYLAIIVHSYASVLSLRLLVDNVEDFTTNYKSKRPPINYNIQADQPLSKVAEDNHVEYQSKHKGISISAASLERFQSTIN